MESAIRPTGQLKLYKQSRQAQRLSDCVNVCRGWWRIALAQLLGIPHFYGSLRIKVFRVDGGIDDFGLVSMRLVTTAGVGFVVDAFQNLVELENLKYHGWGTGTNAESSGDTALQTELTTQTNPDNTRATGTTTEGASANIYKTVATTTFDASAAITEHGIFSQAAVGGGVLLDRSVFSAINVVSGDTIQSQYELTVVAGG